MYANKFKIRILKETNTGMHFLIFPNNQEIGKDNIQLYTRMTTYTCFADDVDWLLGINKTNPYINFSLHAYNLINEDDSNYKYQIKVDATDVWKVETETEEEYKNRFKNYLNKRINESKKSVQYSNYLNDNHEAKNEISKECLEYAYREIQNMFIFINNSEELFGHIKKNIFKIRGI